MSDSTTPITGGPGTELGKLLAKFGIKEEPDCPCADHARVMDSWGVRECRRNVSLIVTWMKREAKRRHMPFIEIAARALVLKAIRLAEQKS